MKRRLEARHDLVAVEPDATTVEGRTISHFRILAKIGEGGMGIVYKAEDLKLGRAVALKVLSRALAGDEEGRLRLIREARTAASVGHPNIAAIHEIDEVDGTVFIAMEYVEGQSLRQILGRGRSLPVKEALRIATGIAEGLARAHQSRIIHRDLKPENVIVAPDGHAKILDFGLAKLQGGGAEVNPSEMETLQLISEDRTREGRIIGTVAYMSPEQARGKSLDARSDLFSFGIVLYEMLTGKRPFSGSTALDTLTAIIRETPMPAIELNPELPEELHRILRKCLEKDPSDRYQDSRDLVVDLKHLARDTDSQPARRAEIRPRARWAPIVSVAVLAVVLALAGAGWFAWKHRSRPGEAPQALEVKMRRLTANPTENPIGSTAISPDGKLLAYNDREGTYLLSIGTGELRSLSLPFTPGTVSVTGWFPDGTRLLLAENAAESRNTLWSYSILSGATRKLRDDTTEAAMSPDGSLIAFGDSEMNSMWTMGADSERARRIVGPVKDSEYLGNPSWSPDSLRIVYEAYRTDKDGKYSTTVESVDRDGGNLNVILSVPDDTGLGGFRWVPDGRLIYALTTSEESVLWGLSIDASGKPESTPRKLASTTGAGWGGLTASADGKRIALYSGQWQSDIYVGALEDGDSRLTTPQRLTLDERNDVAPVWTRDGRSVLFTSGRLGTYDVFKQDLGARSAEPLVSGPDEQGGPQLTPDGGSVLFWRWPAADGGSRRDPSLMRIPLPGGPSEIVLDPGPEGFRGVDPSCRCSSVRCILGEYSENERLLVFRELDPIRGKGKELARTPVEAYPKWALSPDGSQVAIVMWKKPIRTLSLADGIAQEVPVKDWKGWGGLQSVAWSRDAKRLFVTGWRASTSGLLLVDLRGTFQVLWERPEWVVNPAVSPDGRHLAIQSASRESNAWMIENF